MAPPRKRPLWTCPRCGHRFVTRGMWHSCRRVPVAAHFAGKPRILRAAFRRLVALVRACGPVTVYAQKTRIVFQVRVRFGGVVVRARSLETALWLERKADHPTLRRIQPFSEYNSHGYGHYFRLGSPADLDDAFARLIREAYRVGCQEGRASEPG